MLTIARPEHHPSPAARKAPATPTVRPLEPYPFYRDGATRWAWHEEARRRMHEAGAPKGVGEEPLIVADNPDRTVYVAWFPALAGHPEDWTAERALEVCNPLFEGRAHIHYAGTRYFCLSATRSSEGNR